MANINKHKAHEHKRKKRVLGGTIMGSNPMLGVAHV